MSKVEIKDVSNFPEPEEGLKLALSMTPDPALAITRDGHIVAANEIWSDFGVKQEELNGQNLYQFLTERDSNLLIEHIKDLKASQTLNNIALTLPEVKTPFDIRVTFAGNILLLNFRKIPQRSPAIPHSLSEWDSALEAIPAPVFYKDNKMVYRAANNAFLDYLGRPREDIIGKSVFEISPDEQAQIYHEADMALFNRGGHQTYETSVIDKQGREKFVIFHKSQIQNTEGVPTGLIGIILDITDRKIAEQEASEKAAILEAIVQNSYAHIFIKDTEGRYVHVGDSFYRLFGWDSGYMLGKTDDDLFPKDIADKFAESDKHVIETGEVINMKDQLDTPDGLKHHLVVKFALRDKAQKLLGVGMVASDVTELKEAENELKRSSEELEKEVARRTQELSEEIAIRRQTEDELRNILSDSPIAVGVSEPNTGHMSFANESLCKMLGRPREELVGHSTIQFWPDLSVRDRLMKEFTENGRTEPIETQIYNKGKERLWVLLSWTSLTIDGETVIVSWLQDIEKIKNAEAVLQQSNEELEARVAERTQALKAEIEERLKVEKALREREQLLETYASASSDWFWGMDTEFRYNSLSEKFETLTGIPVKSIIGKKRWDYVTPSDADDDVNAYWTKHRELLERHEPFRDMPVHITKSDGNILHALTSGVPTFDENGKFTGYVGIGRDVTDAVIARHRAEVMENQLRQSQKMEAIGQLTGGIAHDFNNILAIVLGNAELMQEMVPPDDKLQKFLSSIDRSAHRGAQLTQRLLAYSRKQELRPEKININSLIANIGELVDRLISEEVEVTYNFNTTTRPVLADPGQLENAFMNLCINARDAMPEGGQLSIKTNNLVVDNSNREKYPDLKPGQYSFLCITDTGKGMDEDVLAHAFEPFFTTKETGKGTGLGLSMIYGFARQSGGTVALTSEPGQGTRARLILPSVIED